MINSCPAVEPYQAVSFLSNKPPYFHDGSADSLVDAVRIMDKVQVGKAFTGDEIGKIVAFLKTLTGEYKGKPLTQSTAEDLK